MATGRVLVVDDDAAIRTVVREALRRVGHTVETAGTAAETTTVIKFNGAQQFIRVKPR